MKNDELIDFIIKDGQVVAWYEDGYMTDRRPVTENERKTLVAVLDGFDRFGYKNKPSKHMLAGDEMFHLFERIRLARRVTSLIEANADVMRYIFSDGVGAPEGPQNREWADAFAQAIVTAKLLGGK